MIRFSGSTRSPNIGDVPLSNIEVTDDQIGDIDCPQSSLDAGESMTCTAEGIAEEGQYRNEGLSGRYGSQRRQGPRQGSEPLSRELKQGKPDIRLEKSTNGEDADSPTGPMIPVGDPVLWEYEVTNTGDVPLSDIQVTDDQIGDIVCPMTTLEPGESMTCTAEGIAEEGLYRNEGRVVGTGPDGTDVRDKDRSHYFGKEEETGLEGCSHGYWKNHLGSVAPDGIFTVDLVGDVFVIPDSIAEIGDDTLLDALNYGGGPGVDGAARNLLRQAVGALLNAAHPDVDFPMTENQVINTVNAGSRDREPSDNSGRQGRVRRRQQPRLSAELARPGPQGPVCYR